MDIIAFQPFNGPVIYGDISIKPGDKFTTTALENREFVCTLDNKPVCASHSQFFTEHLARNYDNQGILRGKLAYKISHMIFNEDQKKIIRNRWSNFLSKHENVILFNDLLYAAPIDTLKELIQSLNMEE